MARIRDIFSSALLLPTLLFPLLFFAHPLLANFEKMLISAYSADPLSETLVKYNDGPMRFFAPKSATETQIHNDIWRRWTRLIPQEYRSIVTRFEIASDGLGNITAYSGPSSVKEKTWVLGIDPADTHPKGRLNPAELDASLVHEFAHILFQRHGQVIYPDIAYKEPFQKHHQHIMARFKEKCPTFFAYGGCAKQSSYLYRYIYDFWRPMLHEWAKEQKLAAFYRMNRRSFVSSYAASHPVEDMAESWTAFVFHERPTSTFNERDKKILFFYRYPELRKLRAKIRAQL